MSKSGSSSSGEEPELESEDESERTTKMKRQEDLVVLPTIKATKELVRLLCERDIRLAPALDPSLK